jgi:hypothetical protein
MISIIPFNASCAFPHFLHVKQRKFKINHHRFLPDPFQSTITIIQILDIAEFDAEKLTASPNKLQINNQTNK